MIDRRFVKAVFLTVTFFLALSLISGQNTFAAENNNRGSKLKIGDYVTFTRLGESVPSLGRITKYASNENSFIVKPIFTREELGRPASWPKYNMGKSSLEITSQQLKKIDPLGKEIDDQFELKSSDSDHRPYPEKGSRLFPENDYSKLEMDGEPSIPKISAIKARDSKFRVGDYVTFTLLGESKPSLGRITKYGSNDWTFMVTPVYTREELGRPDSWPQYTIGKSSLEMTPQQFAKISPLGNEVDAQFELKKGDADHRPYPEKGTRLFPENDYTKSTKFLGAEKGSVKKAQSPVFVGDVVSYSEGGWDYYGRILSIEKDGNLGIQPNMRRKNANRFMEFDSKPITLDPALSEFQAFPFQTFAQMITNRFTDFATAKKSPNTRLDRDDGNWTPRSENLEGMTADERGHRVKLEVGDFVSYHIENGRIGEGRIIGRTEKGMWKVIPFKYEPIPKSDRKGGFRLGTGAKLIAASHQLTQLESVRYRSEAKELTDSLLQKVSVSNVCSLHKLNGVLTP